MIKPTSMGLNPKCPVCGAPLLFNPKDEHASWCSARSAVAAAFRCYECTVPMIPGFPHWSGCTVARRMMEREAKTIVARVWPGDGGYSYEVAKASGATYARGDHLLEDTACDLAAADVMLAREGEELAIEALFNEDTRHAAVELYERLVGRCHVHLSWSQFRACVRVEGPIAPELVAAMVTRERPLHA